MIPPEWIISEREGWVHVDSKYISEDDLHSFLLTEYWAPTRSLAYLATVLARNPMNAERFAEKGFIYKIELDESTGQVRASQVTEPSLIERILNDYLANNKPSSGQKPETQTDRT